MRKKEEPGARMVLIFIFDMRSIGIYKGTKVYEVERQYAAIKESLENSFIITCYWITSSNRARIWCAFWEFSGHR